MPQGQGRYEALYRILQEKFPDRVTGKPIEVIDNLRADFPELDEYFDPNSRLALDLPDWLPSDVRKRVSQREGVTAPPAEPPGFAEAVDFDSKTGTQKRKAPKVIGGVNPPVNLYGREKTWPEEFGTLGANLVPALGGAMSGGAIGAAVGGPPGAVVGGIVGGGVGAFTGEYGKELYEDTTGIAPFSNTNVGVQTAIGMMPWTKGAQAVRGVGPLMAKAAAMGTEEVAGRTFVQQSTAGVGKYLAGQALHEIPAGMIQGGLGTEADIRLRQGRAPSMGERAFGVGAGALFGAGVGAFGGSVSGVRSMRAKAKLGYDQRIEVDRIFGGLDQMYADGQLTRDVRKQVLSQAEPYLDALVDPQHRAASIERLSNLFQRAHQDDLRAQSVAFIDDFQKQAPTRGLYERTQQAQAFINGLRDVQADQDTIDLTIQTLAALTPGNEPPLGGHLALPPAGDAPVGPRQGPFYGAPPEGMPFVNRPDSELPIDRTLPPSGEGEPLPVEVERVGDAMERGLGEPPGPPRLIRRPDVARDLRPGAGILQPEFQPQPSIQPTLKGMRAKEKGIQGPAEQPPLEGAELPLKAEGQIENLPRVRKGEVTPDRGFLLHWLATDLEKGAPDRHEGGTVPSADITAGRKEDEAGAVQRARAGNIGFTLGGTDTLFGLQALGAKKSRAEIAAEIRDYLSGKSRRPTKAVQAALQMTQAWETAYDPNTGAFDWSKLTTPLPQALNVHGEKIKGGYEPRINADMAFDEHGWMGEPRWLVEKYAPHYLAPEEIVPRFSHELTQPPREAQGFLSLLEDQELLDHYSEAIKYGDTEPVAIGWLMHEIEQRGLRDFRQPGLETEGPGTPGKRNFPREIAEQPPATAPNARTFYHGTSAARLKAIQREGLSTRQAGTGTKMGTARQVYLTTTPEGGMRWAGNAAANDMQRGNLPDAVLLEVELPPEVAARVGQDPMFSPGQPERMLGTDIRPEWIKRVWSAKPMDVVSATDQGSYGDVQWRRQIAEQEPSLFDEPLPENPTPELVPPDFSLNRPIAEPSKGVQPGLFNEPPKFGEKPSSAPRRPMGGLFDERGAVGTGRTKAEQTRATRDLTFQNQAFDDLQSLAKKSGGKEVTGLLFGRPDGGITKIVPLANESKTPRQTFEIGAQSFSRAMKQARAEGLEIVGSYHTQPTGSTRPSKADYQGSVADIPLVIIGTDGGDITGAQVWQPSTGSFPWKEGKLGVATLRDPNTPPVFQDIKDVSQFVRAIPRLRASPGDSVGIANWLEKNRGKYEGEAWFVETERLLQAGQSKQAWVKAQSVALLGERAARAGAKAMPDPMLSREAVSMVDGLAKGGAQDPVGSLFALFDGRTITVPGVGRMVVGPEIPPSLKGTDVFTGPGGIISPGERHGKLFNDLTDGTLATRITKEVLEGVDAGELLRDPTRAVPMFKQVSEQLLMTPANFKAIKARIAAGETTLVEVAQQYSHAMSESGRMLGALGNYVQKHGDVIKSIEGIRGASGEVEDLIIKGKGGRTIGRLGDLTADQTFDAIVKPTRSWDRVMLINDLTKEKATGTPTLLEQASRGFMLSQFATAMRNLEAAGLRYTTEMIDLGTEGLAHALSGDAGVNKAKLRMFERAKIPFKLLADHTWVSPLAARKQEFDAIIDSVRGSSGEILRMIKDIDPEGKMSHLLGSVAFGEPTPHGRSKWGIINALVSPKVQNTLGMWNRSQEFTVRSSIYTAEMRAAYKAAGIDDTMIRGMSAEAIAEKVGGMEKLQSIHHNAVSQALNFSFSGDLMQGSIAKHVIDFLNKPMEGGARPGTIFRAAFPFPRFNWSAAPRFIWDHSLVGLALDPLYGVTTGRGRYALGRRATTYENVNIPEANRKISDAEQRVGNALLGRLELGRRLQTYKKMVGRAEKQLSTLTAQPAIPGLDAKVTAASRSLDVLRLERNKLTGSMESLGVDLKKAQSDVADLKAQKATLEGVVRQAQGVDAPRTWEQLLARNIIGGGTMLSAAYLIRNTQDNDTPWYIIKVPKPMGNPDEHIELDFRPFAPFTQYLFAADSLKELLERVDWTGENGVWKDWEEKGYNIDKIYDHYEGKYTKSSFGAELGNAFLSMSQAAGTTLALVDMFTDIPTQGIPDAAKIGETAARIMGTFAARFTIPFAQFKSVSDLVSDDESKARIAPWNKTEGLATNAAMQLMQPAGNLPFLGAMLIPDTVNQITGKPLDTYAPLMRALTGITARERTALQDTLTEAGVAPASIYLRDTGDPFLDRLLGFHYANTLGRALPQILEDPDFARLTTPAQRRDYLQQLLPQLKASAIGETLEDTDPEQFQSARETREGRRRRLRMERLQKLIDDEGLLPKVTPDEEPPAAPEPQDQEPLADEPPAAPLSLGAPPGF